MRENIIRYVTVGIIIITPILTICYVGLYDVIISYDNFAVLVSFCTQLKITNVKRTIYLLMKDTSLLYYF